MFTPHAIAATATSKEDADRSRAEALAYLKRAEMRPNRDPPEENWRRNANDAATFSFFLLATVPSAHFAFRKSGIAPRTWLGRRRADPTIEYRSDE